MRRGRMTTLLVLVVIIASAGAGVAIAGIPHTPNKFVLKSAPPTTATVEATTVPIAADTTVPDTRPQVNIAIIGDSFVTGSDQNTGPDTLWTKLVDHRLDRTNYQVNMRTEGLGGSGYVQTGFTGKAFIDVGPLFVGPQTSIIVIMGGRNDLGTDPSAVGTAAAKLYSALLHSAPNAKLIVVGTVWSNPRLPDDIVTINEQLRAATTAAGGQFVDALGGAWFFDETLSLIGTDGVHPNDRGHNYLAQLMLPIITAAFPPVS